MKKSKAYIFFSIFFLINTIVWSQSSNACEIYIKLDKKNSILEMKINADSSITSFNILKDRFKTKKAQEAFLEDSKKNKVSHTSFHLNFISYEKPQEIELPKNTLIFSIEDLSKSKLKIGSKTKIYFLSKIIDNKYLVYKTYQLPEE